MLEMLRDWIMSVLLAFIGVQASPALDNRPSASAPRQIVISFQAASQEKAKAPECSMPAAAEGPASTPGSELPRSKENNSTAAKDKKSPLVLRLRISPTLSLN